jgi:hypothetical protein
MTPSDILAERIARAHYERFARPDTLDHYPFDRAPGRALMIQDAGRFVAAARAAGLELVEAEDGR